MADVLTELLGVMEKQTDLMNQIVNNSDSSLQSKNVLPGPQSTFKSQPSAVLNSVEKRRLKAISDIFVTEFFNEQRKNQKDVAEKTKIDKVTEPLGAKSKEFDLKNLKGLKGLMGGQKSGGIMDTILGVLGGEGILALITAAIPAIIAVAEVAIPLAIGGLLWYILKKSGFFDWIGKGIEKAAEKFTFWKADVLDPFIKEFTDVMNFAADKIIDSTVSFGKYLAKGWEDSINATEKQLENLGEGATYLMNNFVDGVKSSTKKLSDEADKVMNYIKKTPISEIFGDIFNVIMDRFKDIEKSFDNLYNAITKKIGEFFPKGITGAVEGAVQNAIKGTVNAVKGVNSAIINTSSDILNSTIQTGSGILKSASNMIFGSTIQDFIFSQGKAYPFTNKDELLGMKKDGPADKLLTDNEKMIKGIQEGKDFNFDTGKLSQITGNLFNITQGLSDIKLPKSAEPKSVEPPKLSLENFGINLNTKDTNTMSQRQDKAMSNIANEQGAITEHLKSINMSSSLMIEYLKHIAQNTALMVKGTGQNVSTQTSPIPSGSSSTQNTFQKHTASLYDNRSSYSRSAYALE